MYSGQDRKTHFQEVELVMKPEAGRPNVQVADLPPARGAPWVRVSSTTMPDFHTAPRKQYLVLLEGSVEVISTTGERRTLWPGDILLAEDTVGEGHIVRMNGCSRWAAYFVPEE